MKKLTAILLVASLSACKSSAKPKPEPEKKPETGASRESQINAKKREQQEIQRNLELLRDERDKWRAMPPSEKKVKRLDEINRQEKDLLARRDALDAEIAALEGREPVKPKTADSALDMMEEATKTQEEELAEKIRRQAEEEERKRVEEAARKKEEELARMKEDAEKVKAESRGGSDEKILFEERYADVILNVLKELERFKRR